MADVTPKQLEVLKAMAKPHSWNPTTADVARWAGCSLAAARGRLASLVSPDLVERVGRRWAITPKGRQYLLDVDA